MHKKSKRKQSCCRVVVLLVVIRSVCEKMDEYFLCRVSFLDVGVKKG